MAVKMIFTTPNELVNKIMIHKEIVSIKIECLGMQAYAYRKPRFDKINLLVDNNNDLVIKDVMMSFPVDYIQNIEFTEINGNICYYCVDSHYFKKFIKKEVIEDIDTYEWASRGNKLQELKDKDKLYTDLFKVCKSEDDK